MSYGKDIPAVIAKMREQREWGRVLTPQERWGVQRMQRLAVIAAQRKRARE